MRRAGIREARQYLSDLIDEVQSGREVVITDRGRPVARLLPPDSSATRPLPDLASFRRRLPTLTRPVSSAVIEDRDDRV